MGLKNVYYRHRKIILILLLIFTVLEIAIVPLNASATELSRLPTFATLLLISEILFILGILLMALSIEHDLGPNPLKWRKQLKHLVKNMRTDKRFWVGFWMNMIGALGTGVIVFIGIILVLPIQSWGILWLPIADITITLLLRATVLEIRNEVASRARKPNRELID